MKWYAYEMPPIDWGWEFLPTVPKFAEHLANRAAEAVVDGFSGSTEFPVPKFLRDFEQARDLAQEAGWEGDYRGKPRVFMVPIGGSFEYAFAWKQDNNGTTYVVAPVLMKWLDTGYSEIATAEW